MIRRLRSIVRAEPEEPLASTRPSEAFAGWMLGTLATLVCLWLGDIGTHSLVPGVLLGAILALLGWRHIEWLFWLPPVLVVAVLLQPFSPLPVPGRMGAMAYVDMLMIAVGVIAAVRAVALRRHPFPRTKVDKMMLALLALSAVSAIPAQGHPGSLAGLKVCAVMIAVFYATTTIASRPGGSRWVWPAFPVAAGLVGLHAIVAGLAGGGTLAAQSHMADRAWYSTSGLLNALLCALPACAGLGMDAGHARARRVWGVAAVLGAIGVGLHLAFTDVLSGPHGWELLDDPLRFSTMAVAWLTLVALGRMAWRLAHERPHERARWLALAATFVAMPLLQLGTAVLGSPTSQILLATGGGLIIGTLRAAREGVVPEDVEVDAEEAQNGGVEPLREAA
jgi:hypothetical protein